MMSSEIQTEPNLAVSAIELHKVSKRYQKADVYALNSVSLAINQGEFVTITGPSGSGKSTLLHMVGGIEEPDTGDVIIHGKNPQTAADWTKLRSQTIGFIFQSFHLLPTLTAVENVEIPLYGQLLGSRKRREHSISLLERVGLKDRLYHLPTELSGGEKQRVAIARSLINSPTILLADEPTGNLDTKTSGDILSLFQSIHKEERATIILVTHDQDIAGISERTIKVRDGNIEDDIKR